MTTTSHRPLLLAGAILATTLLAACPFDSPEKHLARGKEFAAKQDHAAAILEFKNVLQTNPKSVEGRFFLGQELLAQGNAKLAEIELQKAYDAKYPRVTVVPLLARAQMLQGDTDKIAAEIARGELKSAPADAELQTVYGMSLLSRGKRDEAQSAFARALQYVPDYAAAMVGDAGIKAAKNDLDGATAEIAAVLAAHPDQVDALVLKGDIARNRNQLSEAIEAYLAATKQAPRNIQARLDLAGSYFATNAFDLAQKQVDELRRIAPNHPGVNYQNALLLFNRKDYPRANEAVTLSVTEAPGNGAAQILAGATALAVNQPEQAAKHLQEGLRLVPNSIYARNLLTTLYLARREPDKALVILRPMLAALPDNTRVVALAGEIALQQGRFADASTYFEHATQLDPSNGTIRTQAAAADFANGDDARGFAVLEAAGEAKSDNAQPTKALVLARLQRQQFDQAADAWKLLQAAQPNDPVTYNLKAAIDLGRKDVDAARQALEKALQLQPDFVPAITNLAALDAQTGHPDAARARYRAFLEKNKGNLSVLLALAQLETASGAPSGVVLPLLQEARKANPTAEQPVIALAQYHVAQVQVPQALAIAQDALSKTPDSPTYLELVGQLQLRSGGYDQAVTAYRKLTVLDPRNSDAQLGLGLALVASNQVDSALQIFTTLIKANPDALKVQGSAVASLLAVNRVDQANRLIAYIRTVAPKSIALPELDADAKFAAKQYADAVAIYRRLFAQTPTPGGAIKLSNALAASGNIPGSNAVLADWLKAHPDDVPVRVFDADVALRAADYPRAVAGYRRALEVRADNPVALNNLAWALEKLKDPQALATAQKAVQLMPTNPSANDTLGWMLVENGELKQGIDFLKTASAAAPSQGDIALHLAKAQIKDGRRDDARATLQAYLKNVPDGPQGVESRSLISSLK